MSTGYIFESPKDTIFAYVPKLTDKYGIGLPPRPKEDPFTTWVRHFVKTVKLPPDYARSALQDPAEFIDILLAQHDALIITILNGHVDVYSNRQVARGIPNEFLEKVEKFLQVYPSTHVGWFQSVNSNPVPSLAAEVIFGMPPDDVEHERRRSMSTGAKKELRRKFWGKGGFDPKTAPEIVDKLLS